jgi:hypothetical protein
MDGDIAAKGLIVDSVLPQRVVDCNGIPRSKWMTRVVLLHDPNMITVSCGISQNVSSDLVIGSNGPLDNNKVRVPITNLLIEDSCKADWIFSLRIWNNTHVFLDGVSLHNQTACYNEAMKVAYCTKRTGMREYEYDAKPQLPISGLSQ